MMEDAIMTEPPIYQVVPMTSWKDVENNKAAPEPPASAAVKTADSTTADKPPPATFVELLQFADRDDYILMVTAFFMATLSGLNNPAQLVIFGSIINSFNQVSGLTQSHFISRICMLNPLVFALLLVVATPQGTIEDSINQVSFLALMYLMVAIQIAITNFLQASRRQIGSS
jgi:hypothetical protein